MKPMTKLSNATVAADAKQGAVIGAFDSDVSLQRANTPAQYFVVAGRNLVVAWAGQAIAGDYVIRVHDTGPPQEFTIKITAVVVVPPPPPPPPPLVTPKSITVTPAAASVPDTSIAGTKVADLAVATSDGSPFAGKVAVTPPGLVDTSPALNSLVLSRSLSSSDDGPHAMTVSASQGGTGVTAGFAMTVTGVAPPPPPPTPPPASGPIITVNGLAAGAVLNIGSAMQVAVSRGPGNLADYIYISPTGNWFYLSGSQALPVAPLRETTITLTAPGEPGPYEAQFFDAGKSMVARAPFGCREAPAPATPPPAAPWCGVPGYRLVNDWQFGSNGNVKTLSDLNALFLSDVPWGRINGELQDFKPFNAQNHVFEADCLALTGLHDATGDYTNLGHITSGALVSRLIVDYPAIVEFVVKLPAGRGVWPSLWLYDTHTPQAQRDDSEIDVLESQFNAPAGQRDDRSMVYQNDHGYQSGISVLSNPGNLDDWGRWRPYGPMPYGDMSARFAAYSVLWEATRVSKFVDDKLGVVRSFKWLGGRDGSRPNILVYNSIGTIGGSWTGPVLPESFAGDNAKFRIKSIRIFKPVI